MVVEGYKALSCAVAKSLSSGVRHTQAPPYSSVFSSVKWEWSDQLVWCFKGAYTNNVGHSVQGLEPSKHSEGTVHKSFSSLVPFEVRHKIEGGGALHSCVSRAQE